MSRRAQPVVVHVVNSLEGGGTERTLLALLRRLDPGRLRHVVVTLRGPGALAKDLPDHVACVPLGCEGRSRLAWMKLGAVLQRYGANVVHARNTGCWMDATLATCLRPRCHAVMGFHGLDFGDTFSPRQRFVGRMARRAGARFACVGHAGAQVLQNQLRLPSRRIEILANGVDRSRYRVATDAARLALKRELGFAAGDFVWGMVGSLVPVKRHLLVLGVVRRLARSGRRVRLVLVGDGPLRDDLARLASKAGMVDRIRFVGWRSDVARWLSGFDGYVCASASEGMSNALLEAMAARLPIVATDVGDNRFLLLDGEAGAIVPPDDEAAMVSKLEVLMDDAAWRTRIAHRASTRCADFDFRRTAAAYESYYARLLGHPIVPITARAIAIDGRSSRRGSGPSLGEDRPRLPSAVGLPCVLVSPRACAMDSTGPDVADAYTGETCVR